MILSIEKYNDHAGDVANGHYHIMIEDNEERIYFGNQHPAESISKRFKFSYWKLAKKYESAYKEKDGYKCIFIKNKKDAMKLAKEVLKLIPECKFLPNGAYNK